MRPCDISRAINRRVWRRHEMICTSAFWADHWTRHALDVATYYWYDGPDHCIRMAVMEDTRGWGVPDPLAPIRAAGL